MKNKAKTTDTQAIAVLILGLTVAFLPTLSRLFGNELILSASTRTDEWLTMLISLTGGAIVGMSIFLWKAKGDQRTKSLAFSIGVLSQSSP